MKCLTFGTSLNKMKHPKAFIVVSFVKMADGCWSKPLLLIDMQRPCVITEKRCDPHHVIANLTIFNTISRAIFMHFLCQIPFDILVL